MVVILFSCNAGSENPVQKDSVISSKPAPPVIDYGSVTKQLVVSPDSDTLIKELTFKNKETHVETSFIISKGDSLFAVLTSRDAKANIRITQIQFPDSTFDGPFGRELKYKISEDGNYKIIMGPNMMAGDPWTGDFTLKVWVR